MEECDLVELRGFEKFGTFDRKPISKEKIHMESDAVALNTKLLWTLRRWLDTREGTVSNFKSRLVARGPQDPRETNSSNMDITGLRVCCLKKGAVVVPASAECGTLIFAGHQW